MNGGIRHSAAAMPPFRFPPGSTWKQPSAHQQHCRIPLVPDTSAFASLQTFDRSPLVVSSRYDCIHQSGSCCTQSYFFGDTELAPALERQLEASVVTERENTGGGFFTTVKVADHAPAVINPSVLGYATHAHIGGLEDGFGFVLFLENGRLAMLEGFAWAARKFAIMLVARD